ncbi:MAG: hypothetical protein J6I45_07785 [Clostridia bacterium]|nr:hypothetical protein [Clostridia bacterium]
MNNEVKKLPEQNPQGYGPKKPEILNLAKAALLSDPEENNDEFWGSINGGGNIISGIEPYCVGVKGENFHFDGVCERVLESLGETELNYWLIAGVTGDAYTQVYPKNHLFYAHRYCVSDYRILYGDDFTAYIKNIFGQLGYGCEYFTADDIAADQKLYRRMLMRYIDSGIPVIQFRKDFNLIIGYEDAGNTLLCQPHEVSPEIIRIEFDNEYLHDESMKGWIFVGDKKSDVDRAKIFRDAVLNMAHILTTDTDRYSFGAGAFRTWADDIRSGYYNDKFLNEDDLWAVHMGFVACYETITRCCRIFLQEALTLNPDMKYISRLIPIFNREGAYSINGLDDLGAGFNTTLEVLQDAEKQNLIADRLELFAKNMDAVVKIMKDNI